MILRPIFAHTLDAILKTDRLLFRQQETVLHCGFSSVHIILMGFLFNEVDRGNLRVGDHVYSWRTAYTYAHHGIFVGDNYVIHFTRGLGQEPGAPTILINSIACSSVPKQHLICPKSSDTCGLQNGNSGVIRSCLDCFLEGGSVRRFEYGVSKAVFFAQVRGGTCTLAQSDPPCTVIHRAMYVLQNGFGNFDLFSNNCEDFAIYCKTGFIVNADVWAGSSGQVAAATSVCSASGVAYRSRDMLYKLPGLALILIAATYCVRRYKADISVRVDKTKVPVEDLDLDLDSSTGIPFDKAKVPMEDLAVYLDSSTGIRADKTTVPVEDVAVVLDSSTCKKPPAEDLAVDHDFSTGIRFDKTKVLVEDVAIVIDSSTCKKPPAEDFPVDHDSSTGIRFDKTKVPVEDVAVVLDSSTCKKPPTEDLAVDLDSSTGIRFDKTKVPVEDVAVVLDSSSGMKPPVAESSTSQATSRNSSSKKKKKKLRQQQHRRNCELVQGVEDVAVFHDSSTCEKPPAQEALDVCLDSSTDIGIDKTKVPVEDVAVFLDSSTGKKSQVEDVAVVLDSSTGQNPLLAESSTCNQAISRNKSSKKQKKKLRQQHRRNSRLVQGVEDAAVLLDSSTGKKPPVEDLAVYPDSSTGIGVEKTTLPVENVTVFLDSSTGKKPILEDLAAYVDSSTGIAVDNSESDQAISRNRSSKKQKKKRRQKQRRNCQ